MGDRPSLDVRHWTRAENAVALAIALVALFVLWYLFDPSSRWYLEMLTRPSSW